MSDVEIDGGDLALRKKRAITLARDIVSKLAERGVTAKIIGSLAGGGFGADSDIDLLITACPRSLKYRIEALVEDTLDGFRFDVVYLDEIPIDRLARFTKDAIDARDLC